MKRIPTDYDLLAEIHRRYYDKFRGFSKDSPDRSSKVYVPINIEELANHFEEDPDIIFGRLYYHLDRKFGYSREDGSSVSFFTLAAGTDKHAVQFPLLSAVLADMIAERSKHAWSFRFSIMALIFSGSSLLLTGLKFWHDEPAKPPITMAPQSAPPVPAPPSP